MLETAVVLTPVHYCYLIGVFVILGVMVMRKDTPAVCIAFLFSSWLYWLRNHTRWHPDRF